LAAGLVGTGGRRGREGFGLVKGIAVSWLIQCPPRDTPPTRAPKRKPTPALELWFGPSIGFQVCDAGLCGLSFTPGSTLYRGPCRFAGIYAGWASASSKCGWRRPSRIALGCGGSDGPDKAVLDKMTPPVFGENELALRKDTSITAAEMLAVAGARDIEPFVDDEPPGFSVHGDGHGSHGSRSESISADLL
jgi:hypothetical protein